MSGSEAKSFERRFFFRQAGLVFPSRNVLGPAEARVAFRKIETTESRPGQRDFVDETATGEQFFRQLFQSGLLSGKEGLRLSRCDARPSFTSGPVKPRNSSANDASKVGPIARSQLFNAYLVQRIAL